MTVSASKARIEELLDDVVDGFAYPLGSYDKCVKDAVMRAGYKLACTMYRGINTMTDPFTLRRMRPTNNFLRFLFIVHAAALIENLRKLKKP